jgi:hypothetical protein
VQFVDVMIRQAHPGPEVPPYASDAQKLGDAVEYKKREGIPWTVLVDDLDGTVHRQYGGMADPTYLIDRDGRVAFYNMWTHAPTLHRAIEALFVQGGRGVTLGGVDRRPHLLAAVANGWRGIERGLPDSYTDLEKAAPGTGAAIWIGSKAAPLLAPVALRSEPVPLPARVAIAAGVAGLALFAARRLTARGSQ